MKNKEKFYEDILEAFTYSGMCEFKISHIHKRNNKCSGISCSECAIKVEQWLEEEYKEPIKLTQFEYDLIMNCCRTTFETISPGDKFNAWWILEGMKQKGYFKEVNPEMKLSEILDNCEIVEY